MDNQQPKPLESVVHTNTMPADFCYVHKVIPNITLDMRYCTCHNFTARPVPGYKASVAILSTPAAMALAKVQQELNLEGLGIKIFDTYRPQEAVDAFKDWASDVDDIIAKDEFYPEVDKTKVFDLGYVALRSGHSRGSTIDLTVINMSTGEELDMGSTFDFFGPISHHDTKLVSKAQNANREVLRRVMMKHGFKPYDCEWWHYTLIDEPYKDTYFNFPVQ